MSLSSQSLSTIPWPIVRKLLIRLTIFSIVAACSLVVWWSVSQRLFPATEQVRGKTLEMNRLVNEVQQLELNWSPAELEKTELRSKQARDRLFAREDAVLNWQKEIEQQAEALGLRALTQIGPVRSHPAAKQHLALQPVTIELRPLDNVASTNSPFRRLLLLAQKLDLPNKRIDLVDLSASRGSNSVQQARLIVNIWTPAKVQP